MKCWLTATARGTMGFHQRRLLFCSLSEPSSTVVVAFVVVAVILLFFSVLAVSRCRRCVCRIRCRMVYLALPIGAAFYCGRCSRGRFFYLLYRSFLLLSSNIVVVAVPSTSAIGAAAFCSLWPNVGVVVVALCTLTACPQNQQWARSGVSSSFQLSFPYK